MTRWAAIVAAFVNLGIHVALAPMHLQEMPYIGAMFVIGSALLGLVVVGLASGHESLRTLAWLAGSAVCTAEIVLFVASRTIGLPGGYEEGWAGTSEDRLGLVCLALEALFIVCAWAGLKRALARSSGGRQTHSSSAGIIRSHDPDTVGTLRHR